jgi:hypothetical protein
MEPLVFFNASSVQSFTAVWYSQASPFPAASLLPCWLLELWESAFALSAAAVLSGAVVASLGGIGPGGAPSEQGCQLASPQSQFSHLPHGVQR